MHQVFVFCTITLFWSSYGFVSSSFWLKSVFPFSRIASSPYSPDYLEKMLSRKKAEVDILYKRHTDSDDPVRRRLDFVASECCMNLTRSLMRGLSGPERDNVNHLSVIIDMKRRSPTVPHCKSILDFHNAKDFAKSLYLSGVDCIFSNVDSLEYGGDWTDLEGCVQASRQYTTRIPPPVVVKDAIIDPIQIAVALEKGATAVLLIQCIVQGDLQTLLDTCTIMGVEAIVEVHTPNELDYALGQGATIILVNMWDRMTGRHFPDQAKAMIDMMPINTVALAGGNIESLQEIYELGMSGYDGVVIGRNLAKIPDIKSFIQDVHSIRGIPREYGNGMKGFPYCG